MPTWISGLMERVGATEALYFWIAYSVLTGSAVLTGPETVAIVALVTTERILEGWTSRQSSVSAPSRLI